MCHVVRAHVSEVRSAQILTKGAVSRELLQEVATGSCGNKHAITWIDQVKVKKNDAGPSAGDSDPLV